MKTLKIFCLLTAVSLLAVRQSVAGTTIGVQFQGRDGSGDVSCTPVCPGCPPLSFDNMAGVVPQGYWNAVDDSSFTPTAEQGTTLALADSSGLPTTVTLTFDCNDSWYNDVTPTNISTPNAKLMNGIIKSSAGGGVPGLFTFNGVPEGQYDLYVYTDMNGDDTQAAISDGDLVTTYYVTLQHTFYNTNTFIQGINTNPTGPGLTNVCNYVKFSNLGTYGRGQIGAVAKWLANNDGIGICGLQLVNTGPASANTNRVSIFKQPDSRRVLAGDTNVTVSVFLATKGPVFSWQWYKNGTLIPGATSATYQLPAIAPTDNAAFFYVVVSNNMNTAQSSNAVITVGQLVTVPGVQTKLWYGATRLTVEDGTGTTNAPDRSLALASFQTPDEQGANYGERVNALFKPPVSGNYVFFICSDDDSDLFLSTDATPAHKQLIAQEVDWAADREWIGNSGGSGAGQVTQKRSDRWSVDTNTPPPYPNGIPLVANTSYYIEAVHHEGGGGDHVEATFKLFGEPDPQNGDPSKITTFYLAPWVQVLDGAYIVVTNQPQDATGLQSRTATFNVGATSGYIGDASGLSPAIAYQWQTAPSGSSTFTNISGASGTTFNTPVLTLADSGRKYRAAMLAADAATNSAAATLTVTPDTTPPRPVEVTGVSADGKTVTLVFDELMAKAATETASGYVFNPGNITATAASLDADLTTVTISTGAAALTAGVTNVLALSAARDLAGNLVASNTTIAFTFQPVTYAADILFDQPLAFYRFEEPAGTAVATNSGSTGGDGAYYTDNEATVGAGGIPSSASGDPGPRPPLFAGFDANNHAATFDGTNRWVDTRNQFLQHLAAFTLEYWISPTNRVADPDTFGTRIGIVGQNDAIEYGFIDQNTIQIWTPPNGGTALNTAYTNADNQWHHVATIASGTSLKTYYDGVQVGTASGVVAEYGGSIYNVHIGGGGVFDAMNNWFTGYIDEVAIFNKAIPAARVAEHYKAGKFGGVVTVSGAVTPTISNVRLSISKSGSNLSISWTPSGGTLQATPALLSTGTLWTNVGTANPATISIGPGSSFYRVSQ